LAPEKEIEQSYCEAHFVKFVWWISVASNRSGQINIPAPMLVAVQAKMPQHATLGPLTLPLELNLRLNLR
jgi:hypothetical protein